MALAQRTLSLTTYPDMDLNAVRVDAGSLFKACVDGDAAYVELLINNGMSPNTCDYNQRTPLHLAASNGHTHIVHFLCNQAVSESIHHPHCSGGLGWGLDSRC